MAGGSPEGRALAGTIRALAAAPVLPEASDSAVLMDPDKRGVQVLAYRIHQRRLLGRAQDANPGALGDAIESRTELVIAIADNELRLLPERRRVAQLLCCPHLRRCARDGQMGDALRVYVDNEEREIGDDATRDARRAPRVFA